jgi:uncharacterized protein with PIN domain
MKFAVDCMLGKLAKWLKILGFDTLFFSRIEDDKLLRVAEQDERVLLTRDTGLYQRASHIQALFIESEDWRKQMDQVLDTFELRKKTRPYSRCIECNQTLKKISKDKAKNLVTPFIYETAEGFALCPLCSRIFWKGTHQQDMEFTIEELMDNKIE